jgi:hypothetical protein
VKLRFDRLEALGDRLVIDAELGGRGAGVLATGVVGPERFAQTARAGVVTEQRTKLAGDKGSGGGDVAGGEVLEGDLVVADERPLPGRGLKAVMAWRCDSLKPDAWAASAPTPTRSRAGFSIADCKALNRSPNGLERPSQAHQGSA